MQTAGWLRTIVFYLGLENNGTIVVRSHLHGENNSPQSAFYTDRKEKTLQSTFFSDRLSKPTWKENVLRIHSPGNSVSPDFGISTGGHSLGGKKYFFTTV